MSRPVPPAPPPPQPPAPQHGGVFVYGTLMPGQANAPVAAAGGDFPHSTPAWIEGFTLLDLQPEGYPALRRSGAGRVHGFLLRYEGEHWPRALPLLDRLEGTDETPPLYTRELVTVRLEGLEGTVTPEGTGPPAIGEGGGRGPLRAWVYLYADEARLTRPGVSVVRTGRWSGGPPEPER